MKPLLGISFGGCVFGAIAIMIVLALIPVYLSRKDVTVAQSETGMNKLLVSSDDIIFFYT